MQRYGALSFAVQSGKTASVGDHTHSPTAYGFGESQANEGTKGYYYFYVDIFTSSGAKLMQPGGEHSHTLTALAVAGGDTSSEEVLPPYYALTFFAKATTSIPE